MKIIIVVGSILVFGLAFVIPVKDIHAIDISVSEECVGDFESNQCKAEYCVVGNITAEWYQDSGIELEEEGFNYEDCSKYQNLADENELRQWLILGTGATIVVCSIAFVYFKKRKSK